MSEQMTWLGISKADLIDGVRRRIGPSANDATVNSCVEKIMRLNESLRAEFTGYWNNGTVNLGIEQGSWSLGRLIDKQGVSVIGAFLGLDWIIRAPINAEASLAKGYDVLGPISEEGLAKAARARQEIR